MWKETATNPVNSESPWECQVVHKCVLLEVSLHKQVQTSPGEEEAAETACDELTTSPNPCPPALLGGGSRESGSEVEPREKGGWGKGILRFRKLRAQFSFLIILPWFDW